MRAPSALRAVSLVALVVAPVLAIAQSNGAVQQGKPDAARVDPDNRKALPVADYARWRSITAPAISSDGKWVAWSYTQVRRDDELHIKQADGGGDRDVVVSGGTRPSFSDDAQWIAYYVAPATTGRGAGRGGRGGAPGAPGAPATPATLPAARGGDAAAAAPPRRVELLNLATQMKTTWEDVATFEFSKGSGYFVVHRARQQPPPRHEGADLIVRDLKLGTDRSIGSVAEFAFNKNGSMLAYTIDAAEDAGNGLYVTDLKAGADRVIENAREHYGRLTWSEDGTALAALHGLDADTLAQRENSIVAAVNVSSDASTMKRVRVAPGTHGVPAKFAISEKGPLVWSTKNDRLIFSLKSQDPKRKAVTEDTLVAASDVDIFHANDDRIQSVQRSQANADRNRTDRAALDLATEKVTRISDTTFRNVFVTRDGRWAVVGDDRKYVSDYTQARADYFRVDVTTGERTPIATGLGRTFGLSPSSRYFLYWKDKQVWSYDLAANKHVNITAKAPVSFVNAEDDHFGDKPAYGVTGYTKDEKYVILDHRYDLWLVSLDGSEAPRNLTSGAGTAKEMRLRYVAFDQEQAAGPAAGGGGGGRGGRGGGGDATIDLSKPMFLSAYGDRTKKSGYYELNQGQVHEIVYQDKSFGRPQKAANADRFLYTREDWTEYPDLRVADHTFENDKKVSDANPQQAEYRWGHRILFDFTDRDGHKLQGTLAIPDGYQPGQRLPMLVNFYEKNSQNLNRYSAPSYLTGMGSSPMQAVSDGYITMLPDVYFHTGSSHSDMLNAVEAAVKKVIAMGYVDPKKIGINGHSFGGEGAAFIGTRSRLFAAVGVGAGVTDLYQDFSQNWGWGYQVPGGSGANGNDYYLYGQGRWGFSPWDKPDVYMFESALTHVPEVTAPFLIMHGTADPTVAFQNGLGFYNALRYNGKNAVLLAYPGEGHGLRGLANRRDLTVRYFQFFDHYLKGTAAPKWMTEGVPYLQKNAVEAAGAVTP